MDMVFDGAGAGVDCGYMLADLVRHKRQPPEPGEPLRQRVESSLAQVERQIWLLRNVLWWYLLPLALTILVFVGQVAWKLRFGGWQTALALSGIVLLVVVAFAGIHRMNQDAVRSELGRDARSSRRCS